MKEHKHPLKFTREKGEGDDKKEVVIAEGHVVVKIPSFEERVELMKEMGINITSANADDLESFKKNINPMEFMTKAYNRVKDLIVSMEITSGQYKFDSLDDLSHTDLIQDFLDEMQDLLMNGIKLGES